MSGVARVLVADDEPDLIEDYQSALVVPGPKDKDKRLAELQDELFGPLKSISDLPPIELVSVHQGEAAVREIAAAQRSHQPFSLAFIDVRMPPGMNGVEAARKIRAIDPALPIVIVTAFADVQTFDLAKSIPPVDRLFLLYKPFHTTEIQQLASALTAARTLELARENGVDPLAPQQNHDVQTVLRGLPGGVALFDKHGRLVEKNSELDSLFPELKDQLSIGTRYSSFRNTIERFISPEHVIRRPAAATVDQLIPSAEGSGFGLRRVGENRWMIIAEQALDGGGLLIQFLDVTALKQMEQRREISNTMTHIARFSEELLRRAELCEQSASALRLHAPGDTPPGLRLLEELRPLTQSTPLEPSGALLDAIANEVAGELNAELRDQIALEVVSSVGLWPVCVDVSQVKRALRAVLANAIEAVGQEGAISVESANMRVTREAAVTLPGLREGDYVCTTIMDNGSGMSPEIVSRAFMPFFTTKDRKRHKGTGLTQAYNIVSQLGGCLFIDSNGCDGTEVRLFFPKGPADTVSRIHSRVMH